MGREDWTEGKVYKFIPDSSQEMLSEKRSLWQSLVETDIDECGTKGKAV